jgi:hypothetical protein
MIRATKQPGFQMVFKNGLTISVQFGKMNYCSRKARTYKEVINDEIENSIESPDAEIAIWSSNDKEPWFDFGSDQVKGWVSADEVAFWITQTQKADNLEDLKTNCKHLTNG